MSSSDLAPRRGSGDNRPMRAFLRPSLYALLALAATLGGCGFQLRGSSTLEFSKVAFQGQGPLLEAIERRVRATGATLIVADPKQAQAVFTLLQEGNAQNPMAYNADGTVAQYQIIESARYQLSDAQGRVLIAPTEISETSNLSYSTGATLAKANESDLLVRGMREDLVERIMFRLGALRPAGGAR
jgi:LPS-assembly lipoprotein